MVITPNGSEPKFNNGIIINGKVGAKSNTVNMELQTLRTIFNKAIDWGFVKENPTKGVQFLKVTDAKKPRFLTKEETKQLLANAKGDYFNIFYTFISTGMRLSKLIYLEWSDIDFKRRK